MAKQFEKLDCRYGAPMGRRFVGDLDQSSGTVRLFKVRLDSGGYDDGGAYWGLRSSGVSLWCAQDKDGDRMFTDAASRRAAALKLGIGDRALRRRLPNAADYGFAVLDGRAPMPHGVDRDDVVEWLKLSGVAMGQEVNA